MYKIQKNIPIPPKVVGRKNPYPFDDMEVGDSFSVPLNKYKAVTYAINRHQKVSNMKFTRRALSNEVRVWRIS